MRRLSSVHGTALRLATTLTLMTHLFESQVAAFDGIGGPGYLRDKAGNVLYPFTSQRNRRRHQQSENSQSAIKRHQELYEHRYSYPSAAAGSSLSEAATGGVQASSARNSFSGQRQPPSSGFPSDFLPPEFNSPFWTSTATIAPPATTSSSPLQSIITSPTLSDIELYQQLLLQQQMYPQQSVVYDSFSEPSKSIFKRFKKRKPKRRKDKNSLLGKLFAKKNKKKKKESDSSSSGYGDDDDDDDLDDYDDDKDDKDFSSEGKKSKLLDAPPIPCSRALGLLGMLGLAHYLQSIIHGVSSKSVHSALHYPEDITLEFLSSTYAPPVMLSDYVHRSTSSAESVVDSKQRIAEVLSGILGEKRSASSLLQKVMKSWAGVSTQLGAKKDGP